MYRSRDSMKPCRVLDTKAQNFRAYNLVDNRLLGCGESLEFKNLSGRAIFIPSGSYGCLLSAWYCGHGKRRRLYFTQLCLPTMIEELDVPRSALEISAQAWISADGKEIGIECVTEGVVALRLRSTQTQIFPGYVAMMNNCSAPFVNGLHSQLGRPILPVRCLASCQRFN
jgi:hypothetical protein